ncbi:MAG: MarR family transcriptional regulator [Actinomycetaceae bacterium]|nr:MarR family transcriptional regulator [Actinomycetaceae bacterium]
MTLDDKQPRDEVDAIMKAWRKVRADVDTSPMEVFSRVSRLARQLDLRRRQAFMAQGLDTWEFDVLSSLRRAGEPFQLTPGQLMTELLVSSGTMTNRIDRLESKGLVRRSPSPRDRRGIYVSLTADGIARVDGALERLLAVERELLAPVSDDDACQISRLLRAILVPLDS